MQIKLKNPKEGAPVNTGDLVLGVGQEGVFKASDAEYLLKTYGFLENLGEVKEEAPKGKGKK